MSRDTIPHSALARRDDGVHGSVEGETGMSKEIQIGTVTTNGWQGEGPPPFDYTSTPIATIPVLVNATKSLSVSIVPAVDAQDVTVLEIWNGTRKLTAYITAIEDVFQSDDASQDVHEAKSLVEAWRWVKHEQ